eukprot:1377841-Amorphochlora_amoeboformis.AAC.1
MTSFLLKNSDTYGHACSRDGHAWSCERDGVTSCYVTVYLEARYYRPGNLRAISGSPAISSTAITIY